MDPRYRERLAARTLMPIPERSSLSSPSMQASFPEPPHPVPAFLGIGVARAGTTWLHSALRTHPDLWLPPIKELHYFDSIDNTLDEGFALQKRAYRLRRYTAGRLAARVKGPRTRQPSLSWDVRFLTGNGSLSWYRSLFQPAAREGYITGEITPAYALLSRDTIERVHKLSPSAKIILVLRDPVSRTWSNLGRYAKKNEKTLTEDELRLRLRKPQNMRRSQYNRTLDNWLAVFPDNQVYIGFFDDLVRNPKIFLDSVCGFLGVEPISNQLPHQLATPIGSGSSTVGDMPDWIRRELARMYEPELRQLRDRVGGPAEEWHDRALRALG